MKTTKTIVVKGKKFNLASVTASMLKTAKPMHKPSAKIVRLKAIVAKMLAKPQPKAAPAAPATKDQIVSSRLKFIRGFLASMAVNPDELKKVSPDELKSLTDEELNLLSRKITAAKRERIYDRLQGSK
tara:strand:+ start:795 stop:1178 length:384 start_codon:yes stop_codon:yes gene_type:complete